MNDITEIHYTSSSGRKYTGIVEAGNHSLALNIIENEGEYSVVGQFRCWSMDECNAVLEKECEKHETREKNMETQIEQIETIAQTEQVQEVAKKSGRPAINKSMEEVKYVRKSLMKAMKSKKLGQHDIARIISVNQSNVSKFLKKVGWTRFSDATIESLYETGLVARPSQEDLDSMQAKQAMTIQTCADEPVVAAKTDTVEVAVKKEIALPQANYTGEVCKVSEAAEDKGYTAATIRQYCKAGKLNYVKPGSRYLVCKDDKYAALPETKLAKISKENAALRSENEKLASQVATMQLEFTYEDSEDTIELDEATQDVVALVEENSKLKEKVAYLDSVILMRVQQEEQAQKEYNKELQHYKNSYAMLSMNMQSVEQEKSFLRRERERAAKLEGENKQLRDALEKYQQTIERQAQIEAEKASKQNYNNSYAGV